MREEIAAAVVFLTRIVKKNTKLTAEQVQEFSDKLSATMVEKFKNHWYSENPLKGQGYRCIRINEADPVDPVIRQAAQDSGLSYRDLQLPSEMTLWIDPREVCCRFGEVNGMYCTLASFQESGGANQAGVIDIDNLIAQHRQRGIIHNAYQFRTYRPPIYNYHQDNRAQRDNSSSKTPSPTWNLHNQVVNANHKRAAPKRPSLMKSAHLMRPLPAIKGDKYRWVRGADLIRA